MEVAKRVCLRAGKRGILLLIVRRHVEKRQSVSAAMAGN
jgi:hypothetical protein